MPTAAASPAFLKDGQILKSRLSLIKVLLALILSSIALAFFNAGQFFRVRGDADGCSALILQEELMRDNIKLALVGAGLLGSVAFLPAAANAASFAGYGNDTNGPEYIITDSASGQLSIAVQSPDQGPYDGSDDTYIGVINNSSSTLYSFNVSSNLDIFGFDGDGIDTVSGASNAIDTTGYGGPQGYFTNIMYNANGTESGTVNFIGGIAGNGGSTYFSLEEALNSVGGTTSVGTTPLPASAPMFGAALLVLGAVGYGLKRKKGVAAV